MLRLPLLVLLLVSTLPTALSASDAVQRCLDTYTKNAAVEGSENGGLTANRDVEVGDVLLTVKAEFVVREADLDPTATAPADRFALYLVQERKKRKASKLHPWLTALPDSPGALSLWREGGMLPGKGVGALDALRGLLEESYKEVASLVTKDEYLWGRAVVASRVARIPGVGLVLAPGVDFVHGHGAPTEDPPRPILRMDTAGNVQLLADRATPKGSQAVVHFPGDDLVHVLHHGFATTHSGVTLPLTPLSAEDLPASKAEALAALPDQAVLVKGGGIPDAIPLYFTVMTMPDSKAAKCAKKSAVEEMLLCVGSADIERKMWKKAALAVRNELGREYSGPPEIPATPAEILMAGHAQILRQAAEALSARAAGVSDEKYKKPDTDKTKDEKPKKKKKKAKKTKAD